MLGTCSPTDNGFPLLAETEIVSPTADEIGWK